jgi:hypothetical protein
LINIRLCFANGMRKNKLHGNTIKMRRHMDIWFFVSLPFFIEEFTGFQKVSSTVPDLDGGSPPPPVSERVTPVVVSPTSTALPLPTWSVPLTSTSPPFSASSSEKPVLEDVPIHLESSLQGVAISLWVLVTLFVAGAVLLIVLVVGLVLVMRRQSQENRVGRLAQRMLSRRLHFAEQDIRNQPMARAAGLVDFTAAPFNAPHPALGVRFSSPLVAPVVTTAVATVAPSPDVLYSVPGAAYAVPRPSLPPKGKNIKETTARLLASKGVVGLAATVTVAAITKPVMSTGEKLVQLTLPWWVIFNPFPPCSGGGLFVGVGSSLSLLCLKVMEKKNLTFM